MTLVGPYPFREYVMERARIELRGGRPTTPSEVVKVALYRAMRADPRLDFPPGPSGRSALAVWVERHDVLGPVPLGRVREVCNWVWYPYRLTFKRRPATQDRAPVERYILAGGV